MRWFKTATVTLWTVLAASVLSGCTGGGADSSDNFFSDLLPPSPGETAREAFNVYDADRRRNAINLLSNAPWGGEAPYLRTYRLLINDPDPTVRAAALRALGSHGGIEDLPAILPYLSDRTPFVRWEAAMALQRLHDESAIEPLIKAVREDEDADVRQAAANALAQYPQPKVFQALVGALDDDDYGVVEEAEHSLAILTGQKLGQDGAAWLAWSENRQDLFAQQQTYFYPQFEKPLTFGQRVQFWKQREEIVPRRPRDTEVAIETPALPDEPEPVTVIQPPPPEPAKPQAAPPHDLGATDPPRPQK